MREKYGADIMEKLNYAKEHEKQLAQLDGETRIRPGESFAFAPQAV